MALHVRMDYRPPSRSEATSTHLNPRSARVYPRSATGAPLEVDRHVERGPIFCCEEPSRVNHARNETLPTRVSFNDCIQMRIVVKYRRPGLIHRHHDLGLGARSPQRSETRRNVHHIAKRTQLHSEDSASAGKINSSTRCQQLVQLDECVRQRLPEGKPQFDRDSERSSTLKGLPVRER